MQDTIDYDGTIISYELIRSKKRKTIGLVVEDDKVIVRAPESNTISEIKKLVQDNAKWILRTRLKQKRKRSDIKIKKSSFLYSGEAIPYVIHRSQKTSKIVLKNNKFHVFTTLNAINADQIINMYYEWLLLEIVPHINKKIEFFSKLTNLVPNELKFKSLSSKWGSMQKPDNVMCLNYHLLKTPRKVIDYVILHELVHIKIGGHGPDFWRFVKHFMPDYEDKKRWLKTNSEMVMHSEDYV